MKIAAKCWVVDHWVRFNLYIGTYENIITFFDAQKLSFLTELEIDFTIVPLELHGRGQSITLLDYLANNGDNNTLVSKFLVYFLNTFTEMSYLNDTKMNFSLSEESSWQNFQITIDTPLPTIIHITVDSDIYTCDDDIITCDQTEEITI
jgi:hypothetical protein